MFPNQQLELKKLSDLHYDSGIPEPFKDLASIAKNTSGNDDMYRHQLIHRSIHGYEQHDPLSTKDVYKFVKDRFDESNDTTKEVIARRVISILVKAGDSEPEERKLYDFAKTIFEDSFEEPIYVAAATDFHWRFAQEFYVKRICSKIVQSVNIDGLRKLSSSFGGKDKAELIDWIDTIIEFIHGYKYKKFWKIITDKDAGIGIWLNQNDDFCKFQDVREDNNIPEDLKDVAKNSHVNKDFREELFSLDSKCSQYLETSPMSISEIGQYIDGKIKEYEGDKQNNDYRSLIFNINRLYKTYPELEKAMPYFMEKKNSLIVGSLGEGEIMDCVASILQQGDGKIKVAKKILEKYTLEELNDILKNKSKPKGPRVGTDGDQSGVEKIQVPKKLLEQYTHKQLNDILENIDKLTVPMIGTEDEPWGGLTKEEMHRYLEEAKDAILDRLSEAGYDISKADWDGWTCVDGVMKDGKEYPLVIRSNRSGRNTTITPKDWMQLMRDNAMFVVKTSNGIGTIRLRDMLRAKDYITIRFSSENLDNEQHINDLFLVFIYFKRIQIDFERFVEPVIGEWLRFVAPEKRTGEKAIPSSRQALPK